MRLTKGAQRPMRTTKALLPSVFSSVPATAQEPPPDTLVDKLRWEASEALESGNQQEAWQNSQ